MSQRGDRGHQREPVDRPPLHASAPPIRAASSWAAKISDNVATDEAEPEVLFTCGQHAREHLTIEMCLYLLNELTSKYATDPTDHGTS